MTFKESAVLMESKPLTVIYCESWFENCHAAHYLLSTCEKKMLIDNSFNLCWMQCGAGHILCVSNKDDTPKEHILKIKNQAL